MRCASPGSFFARWSSIRIWRLRVENTDSITSRIRALVISTAGRCPSFVFVGDDQFDADELEAVVMHTAAVPSVGEQHGSGVRARELEYALALVLVRRSQVIADRRAGAVGDQQQPHSPVPLAFRSAVAVGGVPSELAVGRAAGVVRASQQSTVDQAHLAGCDQLRDRELHAGDRGCQASESAVELRSGRCGKNPGQQPPDRSQKLTVRHQAGDRLRDRERDQFVIGHIANRARSRDRQRTREYIRCNNEGLQRSVHLVLQSRVDKAGGPLLMSPRLLRDGPTHIKPLGMKGAHFGGPHSRTESVCPGFRGRSTLWTE